MIKMKEENQYANIENSNVINNEETPNQNAIFEEGINIANKGKLPQLTQVGRMLEELGIELIYANTPQAKGKIERMNETIQNRLLNDIKRFNIKTYEELNIWFNDFYVNYINKKFYFAENGFIKNISSNNVSSKMHLELNVRKKRQPYILKYLQYIKEEDNN